MLPSFLMAFALQVQPVTLPLELHGDHVVVGGVRVNGRGPYRFLLDTGSQSSMIDSGLAAELNLTARYRVEVVSLSGARWAAGMEVDRIAVGGTEAGDVEVLFEGVASLAAIAPGIRGVLGQTYLSRFDYLIDYNNRTLTLDTTGQLARSVSGTATSLTYLANRPVVSLRGARLVLDSGASALVLSSDALARLGAAVTGPAELRTLSGSVAARSGRLRQLQLGNRILTDVALVVVPGTAREEDGLLPPRLAGSVFVSNSGKYAILGDPLR